MNSQKADAAFRIAGMIGLALLLGLVFWAQRAGKPNAPGGGHDHADPAQHGQEAEGKALEDKQAASLTVSGDVNNEVRIVEYDAFRYGFAPDPLVVRAGERIRLLVKSRDVPHGAMIPEVDFSTKITSGERKAAAVFIAPMEPGEYPVFCNVFCGPEHGDMKARLVVLPARQEGHGSHE